VPAAPAVSCAIVVIERTRVTTSTPESPGIPARNGFNAYVVLSPVTGLFCHRRQRIKFCLSPVGPTQLRELDASVGASGPHDFAVRCNISRPRAVDRSQVFRPALRSHRAQNAAASTATHPAFVTIMIRPLWDGMARLIEMFLPTMEAKYFCKEGWTPLSTNRPTGKSLEPILLSACPRCLFSLVSRTEIRPSFPDVQNCTSGMTPEFERRAASGELRSWPLDKVCYLNKCNL
jgi:hypothetical protein